MTISKLSLLFLLATMATISLSSAARRQSNKFIKTSAVQANPLQLAQTATMVSLTNVKSAASTASILYNKALSSSKPAAKTVKALRDCTELLGDAVDNTKYSLSELKKLNGARGPRVLWSLATVQTYMSAALTKEDTCTDGLKEMGAVVKPVSGSVGTAKKYTSSALGLVNKLRYSYH